MGATVVSGRVTPDLEQAARAADPALADVTASVLVRVGLAVLAGFTVGQAIQHLRGGEHGPASRIPALSDLSTP